MPKNIKHIVRETAPDATDFRFYFDDDGLTGKGSDYCCNLFIVARSRNSRGFNEEEYQGIQNEIEDLLEMYDDIRNGCGAPYATVSAMLLDYGLIDSTSGTERTKQFVRFFNDCKERPTSPYGNYNSKFSAFNTEKTAEYLTLKTGKPWKTESAHGYSQGDYVEMVYCPDYYKNGVKHYGQIWLGAGREFCVISLEGREEVNVEFGYAVADCEVRSDEEYKKLVCEWACIPEEKTQLELIDGCETVTNYTYKTL